MAVAQIENRELPEDDIETQFQDSINNQGTYEGPIDEPINVQIAGQPVTIGPGDVLFQNGELSTTGTIDYNGHQLRELDRFKPNSDGSYTIAGVGYLEDGTRQVVTANGVTGTSTSLDADTATTVTEGITQTSAVTGYSSSQDTFSVDSAGAVIVGDNSFSEIGPSTFTYTDVLKEAEITSASDYNKFTVQGMDFFVDKDDKVSLTYDNNRFNIIADGRVADYSERAGEVTLQPGARYEYLGDAYKNFAIENSGASPLTFCLRFYSDDTYAGCNKVDPLDNIIDIGQEAEYELLGGENFLNIIDARTPFSLNFGEAKLAIGTLYSGPYEIRVGDTRMYRLTYNVPYEILAYDNIEISKDGYMRRRLPENTFTLYTGQARDEFLRKYQELLP